MLNNKPTLINDFQGLSGERYKACLDHYVSYVSQFSFVKAVYQLGSTDQPGLSDLDVIVIVDDIVDPLAMNKLSVHQTQEDPLYHYLFIHDIYLMNESSFKRIHYINYTDRFIHLYGEELTLPEIPDEHREAMALQVIFDFISSRLIQFENFMHQQQLGLRGLLVRVSSLRHSYFLLKQCGIEDVSLDHFVEKINYYRSSYASRAADDIWNLFLESFLHFRHVVHLAARYFQEKIMLFNSPVPTASYLQLNAQFALHFVQNFSESSRPGQGRCVIDYPAALFFHYLGYTANDSDVGKAATRRLTHSGEEVYLLSPAYKASQDIRAAAVSEHRYFLAINQAQFAMGGHVGFDVGWLQARNDALNRVDVTVAALSNPESKVKQFNLIIDRQAVSQSFERLKDGLPVNVVHQDFDVQKYESWVEQYFPDWLERWGHKHYKKFVELFTSYNLLDIQPDDVVMDVAGGYDTYFDQLQCQKIYIQNIEVNEVLKARLRPDVIYLKGDAAQIPLPDASLNKMACHHSFEHFQGDSDSRFIIEIQRLLTPNGRCVIVPLFVGTRFIEVTQKPKPQCHYDQQSQYVVDPTARITGGETCGDYARIYDTSAVNNRIIKHIDLEHFNVDIVEVWIGGQPTPMPNLLSHLEITAINLPYRALVLKRKK